MSGVGEWICENENRKETETIIKNINSAPKRVNPVKKMKKRKNYKKIIHINSEI